MKILLLSDSNSIHTKRWAHSLSTMGFNIAVFSFFPCKDSAPETYKIFSAFNGHISNKFQKNNGSIYKIRYLIAYFKLIKVVKRFRPDIIHSHYASSYGFLGALTFIHPFVLSVWGSDILLFPHISFIHKCVIKWVLSKSDYLYSTSEGMAKEANKYTKKIFSIIPFGVDCNFFKPQNKVHDKFVIGCTKGLLSVYGIDKLIKAFVLVRKTINAELVLVGDGPEKNNLIALATYFGIENNISFIGQVGYKDLPNYYNLFDVCVFLSESESFGVVALESMACGCPVIVSHTVGFDEVVPPNIGFFVDRNNIEEVASKILFVYENKEKIEAKRSEGRNYVLQNYSWERNVNQMSDDYFKIVKS